MIALWPGTAGAGIEAKGETSRIAAALDRAVKTAQSGSRLS